MQLRLPIGLANVCLLGRYVALDLWPLHHECGCPFPRLFDILLLDVAKAPNGHW